MGAVAKSMEAKLRASLTPTRFELKDESARHQGHDHAGVESHFDGDLLHALVAVRAAAQEAGGAEDIAVEDARG